VEPQLGDYLREQRWFGAKTRAIASVTPLDYAWLPGTRGFLAIFRVAYAEGAAETYFVPLLADSLRAWTTPPQDATTDPEFCVALVEYMRGGQALAGQRGAFRFQTTAAFAEILPETARDAVRLRGEQSNTSVVFAQRAILKLFRRLEAGPNPEFEITDFLTRETSFRASPQLAGSIAYESAEGEPTMLATLHAFVPNQGDAWGVIQARLDEYLDTALDSSTGGPDSAFARALVAADAREARVLGELTGRLHMALASASPPSALAAEPITPEDARAWQASMRASLDHALGALASALDALPVAVRDLARRVLEGRAPLVEQLASLDRLAAERVTKIRIHGDYHLGQVLKTTDGFVILDFEGEPARSLAERRAKQCALKDVAGLLRSYSYAAHAARLRVVEVAGDGAAQLEQATALVEAWEQAARSAFLGGYLAETHAHQAPFLPAALEVVETMARVFELDKAVYELHYELNHRPGWVRIPLEALLRLLAPVPAAEPAALREGEGAFQFMACLELREFVGVRAEDERQLADLIEQVPLDSIYYHTHAFFLRHKFLAGNYPNDFATWVALHLHDQALGERLAMVDPSRFPNLEALRDELVSVIDEHLRHFPRLPHVVAAEPFDFVRSRIVEVPTGLEVKTLEEFRQALLDVDASAIYFHLVEARMRLGRGQNDFAAWLDRGLGLTGLASAVQALNPYTGSLERTRGRLLQLCDEALAEGAAR
jgi:trehalose synthase-fused probable maltokinase